MYAFSQIPFNGSLFLEIKSHNPYHDLKTKKKKPFNFALVFLCCYSLYVHIVPLTHSVPATLVFRLLLEQAKHIATQ